ncbi:MAG: hypothetical protein DRP67_03220 [Candidatus Omnitrophota bacterium]|nr:MAG: hypothetical protein DRP67_03220 [Candidatus Omnitrophota bacterium]HDN97772.1 DUF4900 domain-containing protein [bacterium]
MKKGAVLPMIIILAIGATLLGFSFLYIANVQRVTQSIKIKKTKVFWIAEAGIEHGKAFLQKKLEETGLPWQGTEPFTPFPEQDFGGGKYKVIIDPYDDNPGKSVKKYKIISEATLENQKYTKQIDVILRIESFAKFAYFTDNEYNPEIRRKIWFMSKDVIHGPLHSNSRINICGSPTFEGKVTSTASSFNYYHGGPPRDNPKFLQGYELGVDRIDMNKYKNLTRIKNAAISSGLYLRGNYTIILNPNGTLTYKKRRYSRTVRISDINGVVYVDGNVTVYGTLDGRLTIAAGSQYSIYIRSHIKYKTHPSNPNCDDMLGLVAGKSIVVSRYAPPNLKIHATLMAFDKSFYVENWRYRRPSGKLTVWGGIIQAYRGPVGTFYPSSGRIASGYYKDYHYDKRVLDNPPPYFPTTGRYELAEWKERFK